MNFSPYHMLLVAGTLTLSIGSAWHALLRKREPRSALGWCYLCLTLPLAGAALYFVFGVNRVQKRARKLREQATAEHEQSDRDRQYAVQPGTVAALQHATRHRGNEIEPLFGAP